MESIYINASIWIKSMYLKWDFWLLPFCRPLCRHTDLPVSVRGLLFEQHRAQPRSSPDVLQLLFTSDTGHSCQKNMDVFWKLQNFPEAPTLSASASNYLWAYSTMLVRTESTKVIFPMFCRIFSCMKQSLVESRNCICKLSLMKFGQLVYQQLKLSIVGILYLMTLLYLATFCTWSCFLVLEVHSNSCKI